MSKVISKDGTEISYEKQGSGQPLVLVDGAICYRNFGPMPGLAALLAPHFTVYTYDRRGRGESSDTLPYSLAREVEDIDALIQEAGGEALVFGTSSGACLALEAAIQLGAKIKKLAMYEPPYNADESTRQVWIDYRKNLVDSLAAGRRGDAVVLFMQLVGTPAEQIDGMRQAPVWPMFEAVAPTLAYDAAAIGKDRAVPTGRAAAVRTPVLLMDGGANLEMMPFMHHTAVLLAEAIPNSQQRTLEGQTHDVSLEVLAPVLIEFFKGE